MTLSDFKSDLFRKGEIKNQEWLESVISIGKEMGLKDPFNGPYDFTYLDFNGSKIILDEEICFNRYRGKFLALPFFKDFTHLNIQNQRSFCRSREKECLKVGIKHDAWSSRESELFFGSPAEPGDLGSVGNGSPAWKLSALRNSINDIYFHERGEFTRITIFDRIMISGRLMPLKDILKPGMEKPLANFLTRIVSQ